MTTLDESLGRVEGADLVGVLPDGRWEKLEALLSRLSERLNPILVKEARQALRSKQFISTFFLMLAAGWGWSILGLAMMGPGAYYSADGVSMFYTYYLILAFPLLVVAPYSAYHSLSSELQDRTYELVSITSLGARQILTGKLGAVMLQMMIYLSAIFPCLAFTYLLRGLDIFTIIMVVAYTCLASLGLAVLGLLLATLAPPRQQRITSAVAFAMLLFVAFLIIIIPMIQLVANGSILVDDQIFWRVNLAMLTAYSNAFLLAFLSARSQLTTASQNRSSHLRIALVVAQLSLLGWFAYGQMVFGGNTIFAMILLSTMLWYGAGIFLTGESAVLSPRVRRGLPQSLLARVFLTWFTPGPATGYMFVLANMVVMTLMSVLPYEAMGDAIRGFALSSGVNPAPTPTAVIRTRPETLETCVIATSYLAIYLGIGMKLLQWIRRFTEVRIPTRVLVHAILLIFGVGTPWVVQLSSRTLRNMGYTLLQISNPIWTIWECCFKGVPIVGPVLVFGLSAVALVVWVWNLRAVAVEIAQVRVESPPRVAEDDAALVAANSGGPQRQSPWDDDEPADAN